MPKYKVKVVVQREEEIEVSVHQNSHDLVVEETAYRLSLTPGYVSGSMTILDVEDV